MSKYDFNKLLEPYEFQDLVRKIIERNENIKLESFSEGKDNGIDLRKKDYDNTLIVQVKRYKNNFKYLFDSLKKYELPKVKILKPDRYIIATSVDMTTAQKDKLFNLFSKFIKTPKDIITGKDLNSFLEDYPDIELEHPNLWFNSSASFLKKIDNIVNNEIYEESRFEYEEIKKNMNNYVLLPDFYNIKEILSNNHYLLITGNPGVGKTSLAEALCAYYIQKEDFEFFYIRNIKEANQVYKPDKKQLFFIDDFWGSTFKEENHNYDDERRLKQFILKVNHSDNKLLILTSRDYVLKQGFIINDEIEKDLKSMKTLKLKEYNNKLKADILLSILKKSSLPYIYIEHIIENINKIVDHKNFNPRVIEMYTNLNLQDEFNYFTYYESLLDELDNPFSYLKSVYKKQSKEARLLLYLLLTTEQPILLNDLKLVYHKALEVGNFSNISNIDIYKILGQLETNFIKLSNKTYYGMVVDFVNPSINDFLYEFIDEYFQEFSNIIIKSITYFNQFEVLLNTNDNYHSFKLTDENIDILIDKLQNNLDKYKLIRGRFFETIEFEKLNNEEQLSYKIKALIYLNKKNKIPRIQGIIADNIKKILYSLEDGTHKYFMENDLANLIMIVEDTMDYIEYDKEKLINLYYKNSKHALELYYINDFKEIFPKEYSVFKKKYQTEIDKKLKKFILYDLEYYTDNEDYQELDNLIFCLDDELNYLWKNDEYLAEEIDYYSYIPQEYYDKQDIIMNEDYDFDDRSVDEKIDLVEYSFNKLHLNNSHRGINVYEYIDGYLTKQQKKQYIDIIKENEFILFSSSKEYVELFIVCLTEYKYIPSDKKLLNSLIIYKAINNEQLDFQKYYPLLTAIAYISFKTNQKTFERNLILEILEITKDELQNIINTGIIINNGKWLEFTNVNIHMFLLNQYILTLNDEEKEHEFDFIIGSLLDFKEMNFNFVDDLIDFYQYAIDINSKVFSMYFMNHYFHDFINSIDSSSNKSIIKSTLKYFCFGICLEKLKYKNLANYGYSYRNGPTLDLYLLIVDDINLKYNISEEAFNDFINFFKNKFNTEYNYDIELYKICDEDYFYEWLVKYDIEKIILKIYEDIKKLYEITSKGYYYSFEEYKKALI